jgi:hypothetical protein
MAATPPKLTFHFPVAASPDKILILLRLLEQGDAPIFTSEELDRIALDLSDHKNRFTEARILAQQVLGVIVESREGFRLTPAAQVILKKRESVQYDLLHYLFWTVWHPGTPDQYHARSWWYRTLCDHLWSKGQLNLDPQTRQEFTQEINNQAESDFQNVPGFSAESLSLGRQTMAGAIEWLRWLKPSVLEGEAFTRRSACSGEVFLLALSRSYQMSNSEVGMDLLLTPQRRDEICRLCLLEPLRFDHMLDWVLPLFPQFLSQGTRAGSYGRFIRLQRLVTVEALA